MHTKTHHIGFGATVHKRFHSVLSLFRTKMHLNVIQMVKWFHRGDFRNTINLAGLKEILRHTEKKRF